MAAHQIAITFFVAHHKGMILIFFKTNHFFPDIFESGQYIHDFCTMCLRNICTQFRCHNRFDYHRFFVQCFMAQDIVRQKRPGLIAGEQHKFTAIPHSNAHTVSIRVSTQHQIRTNLCTILNSQLQCIFFFRVWRTHCAECTVRFFLAFQNMNLGKAILVQHCSHRNQAGTMQRCIYYFQTFFCNLIG